MTTGIVTTTREETAHSISNVITPFIQNENKYVSSRDIATMFNKRHDHVLRDIRALRCSPAFYERNFGESYEVALMPNGGIRRYPVYNITRDGFMLLVMGFTGRKASNIKQEIIQKFNEMEKSLKSKRVSPTSFDNDAHLLTLVRQYIQELESPSILGNHKNTVTPTT